MPRIDEGAFYRVRDLDTEVKYLRSLFDENHCYDQYEQLHTDTETILTMKEIQAMISAQGPLVDVLCKRISVTLNRSGYNIITSKIFLVYSSHNFFT